jgi:DNA-binding NarL/FixJ family response regulator
VLQAGAAGYVEKGSNPDELVRAVQAALSGARTPVTVPARPKTDGGALPHEQLSDREYQVLRMIGQGRTVSEIAAELFLSQKTVETHLRNIFRKLGVTSRVELARAVERADREARVA